MIGWRFTELMLLLFLIAFFFVRSTDTAKPTRGNNQQNKKLETQLAAFESQVSPKYHCVTTMR